MRLLIVTQYFHPEDFRINQLAFALAGRGHDIVVLTGQPNYPSGRFFPRYGPLRPLRENWQGIAVVRVPIWPRRSGRGWNLGLNYLSFVLSATLFGLPRLRGRFDACLAFCPSPTMIAIPAIIYRFFHGTPVAVWLQDLWPESVLAVTGSRSRLLRAVLDRMVRWIYAHADQLWIQSRAYAESVIAHGGPADRVAYVPNWAEDLYDCARWADIAAEPLPENSLVFAGNLGRAQGLEALIAAAEIAQAENVPAHWVFVGDGPMRPWLEEEIRKRSLARASVLPRRAPAEMPGLLKSASALLITLAGGDVFTRTIPSKVQSCLAAGRPVIAALAGEPARIIAEAQCGYVCPPDDPAALVAAVKRLLRSSKEERDALARNGHACYRDHFTQSQIIAQAVALLERLPQEPRRGTPTSQDSSHPQRGAGSPKCC